MYKRVDEVWKYGRSIEKLSEKCQGCFKDYTFCQAKPSQAPAPAQLAGFS